MLTTYAKLKAYITQYVKSDPRIKGFYWGEDKRLLEDTKKTFPYFWVEDYNGDLQSFQRGEDIYLGWNLEISVKANANRDDVIEQEAALDLTHQICMDFLLFLSVEQSTQSFYFDFHRTKISPQEVYEAEDNWGWRFSVSLYIPDHCAKPLQSAEKYQVSVLQPTYSGSVGDLRIDVSGTVYSVSWDSEASDLRHILLKVVQQIEQDNTAIVKADTDGVYLYLTADSVGASTYTLDLSPTGNTHNWTQDFS